MSEVLVRDVTEADLEEVAAIYAYESAHAYSTFETEQRPAASWLPKLRTGDAFLVAEVDGVVRGFAYASPFRDRPAYHLTRETSVYVHRDARGSRLGTRLYAALLPRLRAQGLHTALALIALPNDGSVRLHENHGFELTGTMREVGDKHDRMIDVGIFQLML
ncbi:GNAT family N-acetyltransferase [Marmoricola sp. RAF53]|uniref:GNAT family N-acetyltransferase n=1 Tax=Marmoricola sp. RAF53 TaxID=3233059 RepID=UPI003F9D2253